MQFVNREIAMILSRFIVALMLSLLLGAQAFALTEQEIEIPMSSSGLFGSVQHTLAATEYRPAGTGPFPLILINHGSPRSAADRVNTTGKYAAQSRALAAQGFVVINPVRRGYGKTGGAWAEDYFSCSNPSYYEAGLETAKDIAAALDYARTIPYVDAGRVVLIGQSAGGFGVLALASRHPAGVLGVVNFAGGRGSRGPNDVCGEDRLTEAFSRYAATTTVPMLWFYSENDLFFGPALAARLAASYRSQGVDVHYIVAPAHGSDGHTFFSDKKNVSAWIGDVLVFMKKTGAMQSP
jgi:dienelactone hydrolase